jgi:hypothetical protein
MLEKWQQFRSMVRFSLRGPYVPAEKDSRVRSWVRKLRWQRGSATRALQIGIFVGMICGLWSLKVATTDLPQEYLKHLQVTNWIMQPGATSMASSSFVDPRVFEALRTNGYETDHTVEAFQRINDRDGVIMSFEPGSIFSPNIAAGAYPSDDHQAVLDAHLASKLGVGIGGTVTILGREFAVSGLSYYTHSPAKEMAFITNVAMSQLTGGQNVHQFDAVKLKPFEAWPPPNVNLDGYKVVTHAHWIQENQDYQDATYTPFFLIPVVLCALALAFNNVLGITREYNAKIPEYGLYRSIGATPGQLFIAELAVLSVLGLAGVLFGLLVAAGIVWVGNTFIIGMTATITGFSLVLGCGIAVVVFLISLMFPFFRLRRLSAIEARRYI